ncbi:MAG: alpha/beta fold hydrolase [Euzebya sp.]
MARAAAGYYRWMIFAALTGRHPRGRTADPVIPVRYLHGSDDTCFTSATAGTAAAYLPPGSVQIVQDAGHFLHLSRPHTVTTAVLNFARNCPRDSQS